MTPERWQQIRDVLAKALELAPEERSDFLNRACSGDSPLRQEVETLLASSDHVRSSFLESPPRVTLTAGTKLGDFEIKSLLGFGGMGEVYRARDSRLGRDVAIKLLTSFLSSDAERLRRFEQEARAAAALNHPNILAVFQMGTHDGAPFLVTELLEGETLREQMKRGLLAARKAIDYGVQVARGLSVAHEKGIIHRDLKPENLFVTKDRRVKILDFGLAKLTQLQPGSEHSVPTLVEDTRPGVVMGTVGYMSPEQVRGQTADRRTDIFSFGAILYEMLSGKRAFQKPTSADTMSAILNEDPPGISQVNTNVPPALQRLVHRCLEKSPEQRFQSAPDLAFALDALLGSGGLASSAQSVKAPGTLFARGIGRILLYVLAGAIAFTAIGFGMLHFLARRAAPRKELIETQLTHTPPENRLLWAAISPDGKLLASTDTKGLRLSVIETGEVHEIPLPEDLRTHLSTAYWFPDGERLLLTSQSEEGFILWVTSIFGGAPRRLRSEHLWPAAAISLQSSSIAFISEGGRGVWEMDASGENLKRILYSEKEWYRALAWSPTGDRLAYLKVGGSTPRVETVSLTGAAPNLVIADRLLYSAGGLLWAPDGRLFFEFRDTDDPLDFGADLWGLDADPQTGKASGKPVRLTNSHGLAVGYPSVSADGRRMAVVRAHSRLDVYVGELKEKGTRLVAPTRLSEGANYDLMSGWSIDSKSILFTSRRRGTGQVFQQTLGNDSAEALTRGGIGRDAEEYPVMTPDGHWILYWSMAHGKASDRLMRYPTAGGPPEQVMEVRDETNLSSSCPSQPGNPCVVATAENGYLVFYALDPVNGRGKEMIRTKLVISRSFGWNLSADGLRLAIVSGEELPGHVRILDSRTSTESTVQFPAGFKLASPSWTTDGNALFIAGSGPSGYVIARLDLDGKFHVLLEGDRNHWLTAPCPSPDGRHLAYSEQTFDTNAWMLENF